ncbi:MAG: ABC transporter permease [Oscillospiraceae bacterium]|nr:ABC transporter permease [Oscillospiraceae bacterium]
MERLISFGNSLPGVLSLGLIWGIMAIGLYITYRILNLSDLTVDGSFCTGGAVCIVMMATGYPTWLAMLCAFLAGMIAGSITGFLHTVCKIPAILSGILTQLGLWTINMIIMGLKEGELVSTLTIPSRTSNPLVSAMFLTKALNGTKPFYLYPPLTMAVATILIIGVLYWFFGTERGCSIRATGANENMARAQGINTNLNKMIGLMLANGLVALSGALFAQYNGNAEINMGRGAIVIGLAAIIIGNVLFGKLFKNFALKLLAVSFGAIIYYIVIQAVLTLLKVDSQYLKLMSAAIVAIFLTVPNINGTHHKKHKKEEVPVCSK